MGKALKIIGIVFLLLIVGFVVLMFWAHGEGEEQMQKFFDRVSTGDSKVFIEALETSKTGPVDPPVIKMWMDHFNERMGKYKGISATNFSTNKQFVDAGTTVECKGLAKFEKGEVDVRIFLLNDKIISYSIEGEALRGPWLKLPLKGPFYRDRAIKFITVLCQRDVKVAKAMMDDKLSEKISAQQIQEGMGVLFKETGPLVEIKVVKEEFIDEEDEKTLKILLQCLFKKGQRMAYVDFTFSSNRGHLTAFKIPYTPSKNIGETQGHMEAFLKLLAEEDVDGFLAKLNHNTFGQLDPPLVKMWMEHTNQAVGKFQEPAAGKFEIKTRNLPGGTVVETSGEGIFEKGRLNLQVTTLNGEIFAVKVTGKAIKGDYLSLPLKEPFYRDRAKKFITLLLQQKIPQAIDMVYEGLRKNLDPEELKRGTQDLMKDAGPLKSIQVIDEKHINNDGEHSLVVLMLCQFEKTKTLARVKFDFETFKAHLVGFKIPMTPQDAGLTPAQVKQMIQKAS